MYMCWNVILLGKVSFESGSTLENHKIFGLGAFENQSFLHPWQDFWGKRFWQSKLSSSLTRFWGYEHSRVKASFGPDKILWVSAFEGALTLQSSNPENLVLWGTTRLEPKAVLLQTRTPTVWNYLVMKRVWHCTGVTYLRLYLLLFFSSSGSVINLVQESLKIHPRSTN